MKSLLYFFKVNSIILVPKYFKIRLYTFVIFSNKFESLTLCNEYKNTRILPLCRFIFFFFFLFPFISISVYAHGSVNVTNPSISQPIILLTNNLTSCIVYVICYYAWYIYSFFIQYNTSKRLPNISQSIAILSVYL